MSKLKSVIVILFLSILACVAKAPAQAAANVTLIKVPQDGIQPQAVIDPSGVLHLIYYKGETAHGDLYYVKRLPGADSSFSKPIRVNSTAGSAIARGGIRGGQIALGKDKTVFVVWNASDAHAVLFSRLDAAKNSFEPQQELLKDAGVVDGGATIAADPKGKVYVFLHAFKKGNDEASGRVYITESKDNGKTFSSSRPVDTAGLGTCACCSMRAMVNDKGHICVLYRSATKNTNRDTTLLVSQDGGRTFSSKKMQDWELNACPVTLFALSETPNGVVAGWETQGKVNFRLLKSGESDTKTFGSASKYPVIASNKNGETLYSWTEGSGWEKGGEARWQLCDKKGKPEGEPGSQAGLKAFSFTAAVAQPDGSFLLIY